MAACKGVIDQITKNLTKMQIISRFLRRNRTTRYLKGPICRQFNTNSRRIAQTNCQNMSYEVHEKYKTTLYENKKHYCTIKIRDLDELTFHKISDDTLHVLMEYFEELGDLGYFDQDYDIEYSDGVLTIRLGGNHGTYVINKQTPNRQIWLSSPTRARDTSPARDMFREVTTLNATTCGRV